MLWRLPVITPWPPCFYNKETLSFISQWTAECISYCEMGYKAECNNFLYTNVTCQNESKEKKFTRACTLTWDLECQRKICLPQVSDKETVVGSSTPICGPMRCLSNTFRFIFQKDQVLSFFESCSALVNVQQRKSSFSQTMVKNKNMKNMAYDGSLQPRVK